MVVHLVSNRPERTVPGARFTLDADEGASLRVVSARPLPSASGPGSRWLVQFEGVVGRESAEELRGTALLAPPIDDASALWVHELVGSRVEDAGGRALGTVAAVVANPASDLLELTGGQLVPLRFVTAHGGGRVVVDVPAGLLE